MVLHAPAIVDIRFSDAGASSGIAARLRGIGVRQVRLFCGLILFTFIVSHFGNHALGNVSYDAMETWLRYHIWWWRSLPGALVLYTAATVHLSLGLWALYQRRHFRFGIVEITQLVLGLSIPLWLASHFVGVRLSGTLYGNQLYYANPLWAYWVNRPYMEWVQFILLIVAWTHACVGLYFWLRMKRFYRWAAPYLLVGAALLPVLALLGLVQGARTVVERSKQPQWRAQNVIRFAPDQRILLDDIIFYFPFGYGALIGLVFAARGVRALREQSRGMVTLSYPDRQVRIPKGLSVLEASLRFSVPHASVCGERARCSTCRIRVLGDRSILPEPSGRESFVLARVGVSADPAIRLACQLRPSADLAFIPLLPPNIGADFLRNRAHVNPGEEHYVVSMFVDMRGSTKFAETRLPFDTIFLVNRFLAAVSQAVVNAGGQPNQFIGDGVLALFGLDCDPPTACRQALRAAATIAVNVAHLNHQLAADLPQPIRFGIGIHGGDVIIGDIGFRDQTVFTALGDAVNVAARLQDMTKALNCQVVVSDSVCAVAGIDAAALPGQEVAIRGRDGQIKVRAVEDPAVLASLLDAGLKPTLGRLHRFACRAFINLLRFRKQIDCRVIGKRGDAVLRPAMPGHDDYKKGEARSAVSD